MVDGLEIIFAIAGETIKSAAVGITFFGAHKLHAHIRGKVESEVKRQRRNAKARARRKAGKGK